MVLVSSFSFKGKKGQSLGIFEIIMVIVLLFIVGVVWMVTSNMSGDINSFLLDDPDFLTTNESRAVLTDVNSNKTSFFNGAFAFFVLGMFLVGGIASWYAPGNPIFFVVMILLIVMILVIPVFLQDASEELSNDFSGANLGFIEWVLSNHLLFSVVFAFFCLATMFFKISYSG